MFQDPQERFIGIFVVFLVTTTTVIKAVTEKDGQESSTCPKIMCTKPPEGLVCNQTVVKSPVLLKRIGKLKTCCPAWRCKEEDGSFSTYFGMSGSEVPGYNGNSTASSGNGSSSDNTTAKPNGDESSHDGPIKVAEDKCAEARTMCPTPDGTDSCVVSTSTEAMSFKPKGELDSCCPTYNCTMVDGTFRLHYLMTGGKMPTDPVAIEKEKGKAEGGKKCPKISCAPEPPMTDDGPKCGATNDSDSSRIKALGTLRECCEVWKCSYEDGAHYTHFELQSPNFWIAETSFQSEPVPVSGDEVTDSSGSKTTVASASKRKAKGKAKAKQPPKTDSDMGRPRSMAEPQVEATETPADLEETTDSEAEVTESETEITESETEATATSTPAVLPQNKKSQPKSNPKKNSKSTTKVTQIVSNGVVVGQTKSTSSSSSQSYSTNSKTSSNTNWKSNSDGTGITVENSETEGNPSPRMSSGSPQGGQMSPAQQQVMMQQQQMQMGPPMGPPLMMGPPPFMGPPLGPPPMMGPPPFMMYG